MSSTHGLFVTIDGPSGIGKTTITAELADLLRAHGYPVVATTEPTHTPLGALTRYGTDDYHGLTLACLVTADRYQHLDTEIRPALRTGNIVISDRYLASTLVLQRLDGVDPRFLWHLNVHADRPDLSIILTGNPTRSRDRATKRGTYSRFHRGGTIVSITETELYLQVATELANAGFTVTYLDIGDQDPHDIATTLLPTILTTLDDQTRSGDAARTRES